MPHGSSPKHVRKARRKPSRSGGGRGAGAPRDEASAKGPSAPAKPEADAPVRLQKLLAAAGFGSRRESEQFLIDERVTVNGRVAGLGDRADPAVDDIRVDGERLVSERPAYWLLHKPRGVVTTTRDESGRRTVIDLLPRAAGRVFPVGRLDRETSGLVLLTNDGDTAHALLHPSLGNEREYTVTVKGRLDDRAVARLEKGVVLEEGRTAPARIGRLHVDPEQETTRFSLTLVEGRKRQIRRSLLQLGFPVRRLVRIRMGPLRLGRLPVGEARPLRAPERRALLEHAARLRAEAGGEGPPRRARKAQPTRASRKGTRR